MTWNGYFFNQGRREMERDKSVPCGKVTRKDKLYSISLNHRVKQIKCVGQLFLHVATNYSIKKIKLNNYVIL